MVTFIWGNVANGRLHLMSSTLQYVVREFICFVVNKIPEFIQKLNIICDAFNHLCMMVLAYAFNL